MAVKTCLKPPMSIISASGNVCSFNSLQEGLPLKSHVVQLVATQSGSGTPSPVNVRTINGYSAINIGSDNKYAGFINFNQIVGDTYVTTTFEGITTSYDSTTNEFSIRNDNRTAKYNTGSTQGILSAIKPQIGHIYYADIISDSDIKGVLIGVATGAVAYNYPFLGALTSYPEGQTFHLRVDYRYDFVNKHPIGDITKFKIVLMDLTEMFGAGNEPSTVDEVRALFPNDYYDYNAGTLTTVSAVNGVSNSMFTIQIGSTVYGGEYDARSGVLTVTHEGCDLGTLSYTYNSSYGAFRSLGITDSFYHDTTDLNNLSTIYTEIGTMSSSADDYTFCLNSYSHGTNALFIKDNRFTSEQIADFKQSVNGQLIVYKIATPIEIQLPPCPIDTLEGVNNIFSDVGNTSLEAFKIGR